MSRGGGARAPRWAILCLAFALSFASARTEAASAQSVAELTPTRATRSPFWRAVAEPGSARARRLLSRARALITGARFSQTRRRTTLEGAIARLERARALAPNDPEILFDLAVATAAWERPRPLAVERRTAEAIRHFEALRALDPSYQAESVAFSLGVLYTRTHDFARAAEEYKRALDRAEEPLETIPMHSNLAEVSMEAGDLETAVAHFEEAAALAADAPDGGRGRALALFGLAVALDRIGDHALALERIHDAIVGTPAGLQLLRDGGVFFEPPFEIHYYDGLGFLALAAHQREEAERASTLAKAKAAFSRFLREGGRRSIWRADAERHQANIEAQLNEAR